MKASQLFASVRTYPQPVGTAACTPPDVSYALQISSSSDWAVTLQSLLIQLRVLISKPWFLLKHLPELHHLPWGHAVNAFLMKSQFPVSPSSWALALSELPYDRVNYEFKQGLKKGCWEQAAWPLLALTRSPASSPASRQEEQICFSSGVQKPRNGSQRISHWKPYKGRAQEKERGWNGCIFTNADRQTTAGSALCPPCLA